MKNKKTIITITITTIVAVLLVIIGVTYAYWLVTRTQTNQNVISTGCLDITLNGEKNDITLTEQFPLSDEDGMKLVPYEFTVTNNCNTSVDYQVNLESIGDSSTAIKASAIKVSLNDDIKLLTADGNVEPTVSGAYESNRIIFGTLAGASDETTNDTVTYELRIWIDANAPISEQNKLYTGKISVTIGQGIFNPYKEGTLAHSIISSYGGKEAIEEITNFEDNYETGLFKSQDNLGDSYYLRGEIANNYVQFGEWQGDSVLSIFTNDGWAEEIDIDDGTPMYWRIVRINGDGTIRLIYDGIEKIENGTPEYMPSKPTASIGFGVFNSDASASKFMGYTYENSSGIQTDSSIKKTVDQWYKKHLLEKYNSYISDSIFCNDREVYKYTYIDGNLKETTDPNQAFYIDELYTSSFRGSQNLPSLQCNQKNDRYTVADMINGNGYLTYPVGLITFDEIQMGGGIYDVGNTFYYLYTGSEFWTLTPGAWLDLVTSTNVWNVESNGAISASSVGNRYSVRPVINLKADVKFTGDGTFKTPYVIVTE